MPLSFIFTLLAWSVLNTPLFSAELTLPAPAFLYVDSSGPGGVMNQHGDAEVCQLMPSTGGFSSSFSFMFDTDEYYQAHAATGMRYQTPVHTTAVGASSTPCNVIKGLVGNTLYRVCPVLSSGGNSTICTSAGTDANRFFTFTTPATPTPEPALPTRANVSDFDTSMPTVTGGDLSATCGNLSTQLATQMAASDGDSKVRSVTLSHTLTCSSGTITLDISAFTPRTTTTWVILQTDLVANLPLAGGRVVGATDGSNMPTLVITATGSSASVFKALSSGASYLRFVGFHLQFADGTAVAHAANPTYSGAFIYQITSHTDHIIFDRCWWDGVGYPARIESAIYSSNNADVVQYLAFLGNDFTNIYNWLGWMTSLTASASTKTLTVTGPFLVGRGDQVCTVASFTATTTDSTTITTGMRLFLDTSCNNKLYYPSGSAPTTTGSLTATATPPGSTDFIYDNQGHDGSAAQIGTTSGNWNTSGGVPNYFWGTAGIGLGIISLIGESPSNCVQFDFNGLSQTNQKIIFNNNSCTGSGILFFMSSKGLTHDMVVSNNTFTGFTGCYLLGGLTPTSGSPPFICDNRYPLEWKNGYSLDIIGNIINGNYGMSTNTGMGWVSFKPDVVTTNGAYTGDAYVANNYATNTVGAFYLSAEPNNASAPWTTPKPVRRILYENNFTQSDAFANTSYWIRPSVGVPGTTFYGFVASTDQGGIDVTYRHNTFDSRGIAPWGVGLLETPSHGIASYGNIYTYQPGFHNQQGIWSGYYGTGNWSAPGTPDVGFAGQLNGNAALAVAVPAFTTAGIGSSFIWDNVFIGMCVSGTNCVNGTSAITVPIAGYPTTTRWPGPTTSTTVGARYQTISNNYHATNYILDYVGSCGSTSGGSSPPYSSPYQPGCNPASDGTQYGYDPVANSRGLGIVSSPRATLLSTTGATIAFTAPVLGQSCSVGYNTTGIAPWTYSTADTSSTYARTIALTGLTIHGAYKFIVQCSGITATTVQPFQLL